LVTEKSRRLLKKQIEKNGLVETLCWNERSGVLVSGHLRLSILDDLNHYEPPFEDLPLKNDYLVGVAVVRLSEKQERALNVFMNNAAAQGNFSEALLQMVAEGLDLEEVGMGEEDLAAMFPGATLPAAGAGPLAPVEAVVAIHSEKQATHTAAPPKEETDALMVVWPSTAERNAWLESVGLDPGGRFWSSKEFFGG
jgi:hypothetical protein